MVVKNSDAVVANVAVGCSFGPENHTTFAEFHPVERMLGSVQIVDSFGFCVDHHVFVVYSTYFVREVLLKIRGTLHLLELYLGLM